MSLSKEQFEQIMRGYEERRLRNYHEHNKRKQKVYTLIPEYQQLEETAASDAVMRVKQLIDGASAPPFSHVSVEERIQKKKALLLEHNLPENYLEPIYTCPDCQDTGYIQSNKCHCFRKQELTLLYEQSNIQEMIKRENFSTLSYEYYQGEDLIRFQNAVHVSKDFVAGFKNHYQNLFFYGTVGTGKSFLSGCIAAELLSQSYSVIYFSANSLFETLSRYSFDIKSKDSLYNLYKDLYNCDLVIIDDLGTEVTNAFVTSQLFTLLNERHMRQKSTIISTNLSLEELRDRYSDRVFSRITSNYAICKLTGPDIRIQRKLSGKLLTNTYNHNAQ